MSVRSFKIFSLVSAAHIIIFSVVWVGFTAPPPRPGVIYTYEGALPGQETESENWQSGKSDKFLFNHLGSSFDHWARFRDPAKPVTYDHLGF